MRGRAQASTGTHPAPTGHSTWQSTPTAPGSSGTPAATRQTGGRRASGHAPERSRRRRPGPPGAPRVAPVRDAVPVQITTLGALAVDGRPVRGDRLVALVGALVDA